MEFEEKTIAVNPIYDGKIIKVRVEDVVLPNGKTSKRELIAHPGGVGVIAITDDNRVLMVEQYRIACRKMLLEIPAGKLEYGEDPQACGERELEEETGYRADEITFLGEYYPTPGYDEEKISVYMARGLHKTHQHLDPGEFLNVKSYTLDELFDMVMRNEILDAKTAIAILKAKAIAG